MGQKWVEAEAVGRSRKQKGLGRGGEAGTRVYRQEAGQMLACTRVGLLDSSATFLSATACLWEGQN